MLYGKYHFVCRFESEAVLPHYKGSTLRGVFGRALKQVVCALRHQTCDQCLLKDRCVYVDVFETQTRSQPVGNQAGMARPHPFVIEPPDTPETHFLPGTPFEFNLLLFGKANAHLPYFIYAFDRISQIGIGKKINGRRGVFNLEGVTIDGRTLYSAEDKQLKMPPDGTELTLLEPVPKKTLSRIELFMETPLRLKFSNRLKADLPFHVLVRGMLRRMSSLMTVYGNGEPALDYTGLVRRSEAVRIIGDRLEWFDWRRYSFRQDRENAHGGHDGLGGLRRRNRRIHAVDPVL